MYLEIGVSLRSRPLLRKRVVQICSCWRRRRLTSLKGRSRSGFGFGLSCVGRPHKFIEQCRMHGTASRLRRPTSFAGWEGRSLQRLICVTNRSAWGGTAPVREDYLTSFWRNRSRQTVNRWHQVANRSRQTVNRWHQVAKRSRQVIAVGPQGETTSQRLTASEILRQSDAVF